MPPQETVVMVRIEDVRIPTTEPERLTLFHGWLLCALNPPFKNESDEELYETLRIPFPNAVSYEVSLDREDAVYLRKWDEHGTSAIIGRYRANNGLVVITDQILVANPEFAAGRKLAKKTLIEVNPSA